MDNVPQTESSGISETARRDALKRVLASELFDGAGRIRDFVTYIVEEEIAGRGESIRGKTIAQDVYGRDPTEDGDPENIVRVDARRLRQSLTHYYETTGAGDPLRIHVDSGRYCPRYERMTA